MSLPSLLRWLIGGVAANQRRRTQYPGRTAASRHSRLTLEQLEDRTLPSSYTAGSVVELIASINAANLAGGANTITLTAKTTFTLTAADNITDGATGLPVITANDILTINGNGDTLERSTTGSTPAFRLFDIAAVGSLTLANVTLQGGWAISGGVGSSGGAILNQGTLALYNVTVQNNIALGSTGESAAGGAIYSNGALTVQDSTIRNNQAVGGAGSREYLTPPGPGGSAFGGGLYVASGTATLTRVTVSSNIAQGGAGGNALNGDPYGGSRGGNGGSGFGGGLYVSGGTVTLSSDSVMQNAANGGAGGSGGTGKYKGPNGSPGLGEGGGIYVDPVALVYLDLFTQANVKHNHASTSYPDIAAPTILF